MTATQRMINDMHLGNIDTIIDGISSGCDILVLNAIMAGTKYSVNDLQFIKGVYAAKKSDAVMLGIPIKSVATASLHLLNIEKYDGSDAVIEGFIKNRFGI